MDREIVYFPWQGRLPVSHGGRALVAALLRRTSAALAHLASSVAGTTSHGPAREPLFEFYAEAGAPEGALYVDGDLVGVVTGVSRL